MKANLINPAQGLYVRNAVDNISWVDLGEFVVVVDALEQKSLREEVSEMLSSTCPDKPVKYLMNTHCHYDHIALNSYFESQGAEIISTKNSDETVFNGSNGLSLSFIPFPGCHSKEDAIVYIPELKTMLIGDIFGWGLIPWEGVLTTGKIAHIISSYQTLIDIDAQTIIPGHGPVATTSELERWLDYFINLVEKRRKGTLYADEPAPHDMANWWRFAEWKHQDTVNKLIAAKLA